MDVATYMAENPHASRKQIMKACGVSSRQVRRAEEHPELQAAGSTHLRALALVGGLAGLLVVAGLTARALAPAGPGAANRGGSALQLHDRTAEAAIYSALDVRDVTQVAEVAPHLESEQEPLRLAAIRFLASVDPEPHLDRLIARADDPSQRVRIATIQLLGRVQPKAPSAQALLSDCLIGILLDPERDLAERRVALTGLSERTLPRPERLLPLLDDRRLSAPTSGLLARLTGTAVTTNDPLQLRAAWTQSLEGSK